MFSDKEARALIRMKQDYAQEKHETATFYVKHLEFLRWLIAHGKMDMDIVQPENISWREYEQSLSIHRG